MLKTTHQCHFSIMFPKYWNDLCTTKSLTIFPLYFQLSVWFSATQINFATVLIYFNDLVTSKNETDAIYLDISKSFDSVSHKILLNKLWSIGIIKLLWTWFYSYLTGRYQCVRINKCLSETLPVLSGVPQGSILGPLLFIIYVHQ